MKRLIVLAFIALFTLGLFAQGVPHNAMIQVQTAGGGEPVMGDVAFYGWIVGHEANILYFNVAGQPNAGSWVYMPTGQGYGMCVAQLSTFNGVYGYNWVVGDVFHIEIEELSTGHTASGDLTVSPADFDILAPPLVLAGAGGDTPDEPVLDAPLDGAMDQLNIVQLHWTGGMYTEGYNLYYGTDPDPYTNGTMVDVGNATTYSLPNMPYDGTMYYWTVEAYNSDRAMTRANKDGVSRRIQNDNSRLNSTVPAPYCFTMFDDPNDAGSDENVGGTGEGDTNVNGATYTGNVNVVGDGPAYTGEYVVTYNQDAVNPGAPTATIVGGSIIFTVPENVVLTLHIDPQPNWADSAPGTPGEVNQFMYYDGTWHYNFLGNMWVDDLTNSIADGIDLQWDFTSRAGSVEFIWNAEDETLPVTLSSFTATYTAENFVQLTWVTESETDMMGYHVLRAENEDVNSAIRITPTIIDAVNSPETHTYTHQDAEIENDSEYYYWVESIEMGGATMMYGPQHVVIENGDAPELPQTTKLHGAYPNPFNPTTTLKFQIKENETATLTVYNVLGQTVKTFGNFEAGHHDIPWLGKDDKGNNVSSGVYFYILESASTKEIKKMMLLK